MEQKIISMFAYGCTVLEITKATGKQMGEVLPLIIHLAKVGQVDLTSWIEENIHWGSLSKGIHYFSENPNPTISGASQDLGLDFSVLALCEYYAMQNKKLQEGKYIEIDRYTTQDGVVRIFCQSPNKGEGFDYELIKAQSTRDNIIVLLFPNPDWSIPCATQVPGLSGNLTQEVPYNYEFQSSVKELVPLN